MSAAQEYLAKQMWTGASSFFLNFSPPSHVFAPGSEEGIGSSTLTADGVVAN